MSSGKSKIKIVYIIDMLRIGGTEKQLLKTIELLDKKQFKPILILLRPSLYVDQLSLPCNIRILNISSLLSINGFLKSLSFAKYLKKHQIDIVQTYFFDSSIFGLFAAKLAHVKLTIFCKRDVGYWYKPHLLIILRFVNYFVDRFLVNSLAVKNSIREHEFVAQSKVDIIYNGIDVELFNGSSNKISLKKKIGIKNEDFVVGIVANLNRPVKRIDLFINMAYEVLQKRKDVSFLIIGDGRLQQELQNLCKEKGIRGNIHFLGAIDDVHVWLEIFDIGISCSDSEGFSNAILEYASSGIPVIATNSDGNRELFGNGNFGELVNTGSVFEMAERVNDLLDNEAKRLEMSISGKNMVEKEFNWKVKILEIENYYRELIRKDTITN